METIIYISLGIILLSVCMIYYSFKKILNAHSNEIINLKKELLKQQENINLGDLVNITPNQKNNKESFNVPTNNTNLKQEYMAYQNNNIDNISEDLKTKIHALEISIEQ